MATTPSTGPALPAWLFFLGERVGWIEGLGILLAILAAVALSQETKPAEALPINPN